MDAWFSFEVDDIGLDRPLPDAYWESFNDCASSFITNNNGSGSFGVGDADLMNSATKVDMEMDNKCFFGGDFMQDQPIQSSSSLSSKRSLSVDSGNSCSSFMFDPSEKSMLLAENPVVSHPIPTPRQPYNDHQNHHAQAAALARGDDDAVITRAMMAVISSASSSASSSPAPVVSPLHQEGQAMQPHANGKFAAFTPDQYSAAGASCEQMGTCHGQMMIKNSLSMSEKITSLNSDDHGHPRDQSRPATSSNQLYHMISERKRREKLNESFQTLRTLLPPNSKRDKTSVLINATNYLKALKAQILELELKNKKLETCIPSEVGSKDVATARTNEKAKVEIIKASHPASELQQIINLRIVIMVECDIAELVLHILECLKWMKAISILSVDANTYSPQMQLQAIASIKLQIVDCGWNEAVFQEAMTKAVNDATSSRTPWCSELSNPF